MVTTSSWLSLLAMGLFIFLLAGGFDEVKKLIDSIKNSNTISATTTS